MSPLPPIPSEIEAAMGAPPTEEQWRAISMPLEPYVLIAGAGSGKTSVMAARVVYLALVATGRVETDHEGAMPGNVLCLTFTNKATDNLRVRVRRALAELHLGEGEEPEISNYHGFAASLLQRYGMLAGYEPGTRVLSAAQRTALCARVLDRMTFEHAAATYQPSLVSKILELDDQMQNHLVIPSDADEWLEGRLHTLRSARSERVYKAAQERLELTRAAGLYRELKRELGVIDFGDQIQRAIDVMEQHPGVVADHRERFQAVLLDEYQDTNVAQAKLMRLVFGDGHPVTAVGDPDQNIYAWRGASLYNLLEFSTQFPCADGSPSSRLPLYTNFRSGSRILAAADAIIQPVPTRLRPDANKQLVPHPPNGAGEVTLTRCTDEWTEAGGIAARVVALHEGGAAWSDVAVLCRTSRLFGLLQQAFTERGVPVEVLGLAGLLSQPEVVEVLAYARAVQDPTASVALARILMGARYRVGFKDVAVLARAAGAHTRELRESLGLDEDDRFLVSEVLEHLDDVDGLSDEGRARVKDFGSELRALRVEARRPVGEFLGEVIRRTGILAELDADVDRTRAVSARRNLAAFLDEVHAFEPLEGELTLRAFLDHVDAVEALDKQEWAPVQPSDEDSVKAMTIHVAKGLEFDHVFVPGMAHDILPNPAVPQNPAERGKSLDFELRGDRDILPAFDGNLSAFREALKEQEIVEERRTAYVALTRARRSLHVSGSLWYGDNSRPKKPSLFLDELFAWGEGSGEATVERGPDDPGDVNPMLGFRARFVRDWPGPARPDASGDDAFLQGWRHAALEASLAGGVQRSLVETLSDDARASFERLAAERRQLAAHLREREIAESMPPSEATPISVSVGGVTTYVQCPKRFYWSSVRPLPRFSGPAARIGTDVHKWIERRARGQGQLLEVSDLPDLTDEELAGDPGRVERLRQAFIESRFNDVSPLFAERAFLLRIGAMSVAGRIDAVYGTPEGPWEVVDWKTGKRPADDDPSLGLQLDLYGLACVEIWGKTADDVTLTYFYLASGEEVVRAMDDPSMVRERVADSLRAIQEGTFDPTPGRWCHHCDFRAFCDAGKAWLAASD